MKLQAIRDILKKRDLHLNKKLGQHLLIDQNVIEKIVQAAEIQENDNIFEIGPGLGALTRRFIEEKCAVWAVEKDRGFFNFLIEHLPKDRLTLVHDDALELKMSEFLPPANRPFKLIANLPYNITTPLLFKILKTPKIFEKIIVMVQKEAAERLLATPSSKAYNAVTVKMALLAQVKKLFSVNKGCFFPQPDVESQVIEIIPNKSCHQNQLEPLFSLINQGFAHRRKKLINNLKVKNYSKKELEQVFINCSLALNIRAEELTAADFISLYRELSLWKEGTADEE